jgi:diguanylate cyclase (GGDEF)-like protein
VAGRLRTQLPPPALIGRLGGEEFVVVLPNVDQQQALALAERLREEVSTIDTRRWLADRKITVSIGLTLSKSEDTPSTMLQRADAALYDAKRAGRNCVKVRLAAEADDGAKASVKGAAPDDAAHVEFA